MSSSRGERSCPIRADVVGMGIHRVVDGKNGEVLVGAAVCPWGERLRGRRGLCELCDSGRTW
jgi:hypothetical protein